MRASAKGALPTPTTSTLEGISLPSGSEKSPDPGFASCRGRTGPALWISDGPVSTELWIDLASAFPQTGLWPVFVEGLMGPGGSDRRPWDEGEFDPDDTAKITTVDPATWFAELSAAENDPEWADEGPSRTFEQLAAAEATRSHRIDDVIRSMPQSLRLALIPAERPADAITEVGWQGPLNVTDDMAPYSAVLRSWEGRFYAYVVKIGFDTLTVVFQNTPTAPDNLARLATEIYFVCPDLVDQNLGSMEALADQLEQSGVVELWWD